jgi:hypothetical protein
VPSGGYPAQHRAGGPSGGYPAQPAGTTPSGGHPAQHASAGDENRTPLLIAIGVVAVVLVVIIVLIVNRGGGDAAGGRDDTTETTEEASGTTTTSESGGGEPAGYTEQFQQDFLDGCTGSGGSTESQCQCVLDYLMANVPISDLTEWYEDSTTHPEINQAAQDCVGA